MAIAPLAAATAAAFLLTGVLLAAAGVRRVPPKPPAPRRSLGVAARFAALQQRTRVLLIAGSAAGVLAALMTGWVIAIVLLPAAAVGVPYLLSAPESAAGIERLEAMEEWTRALAGVLTVGLSLENALVSTLRSTPPAIHPEVSTLVARLRARWQTKQALQAFADDLNDSTGDLIAANLLLAAERRGAGLASVLEGLAESVAQDVRVRRSIEADRAKPRATARWITIITIGALALLGLNGTYIRPYGSPLGQLLLATLLGVFIALLVWLRSMAKGDPLPRFIGQSLRSRS